MKSQDFNLIKYDADEGMVFDWAEPHSTDIIDDKGNVIDTKVEHLYTKTIFIGAHDNIDNYIEVKAPMEEQV